MRGKNIFTVRVVRLAALFGCFYSGVYIILKIIELMTYYGDCRKVGAIVDLLVDSGVSLAGRLFTLFGCFILVNMLYGINTLTKKSFCSSTVFLAVGETIIFSCWAYYFFSTFFSPGGSGDLASLMDYICRMLFSLTGIFICAFTLNGTRKKISLVPLAVGVSLRTLFYAAAYIVPLIIRKTVSGDDFLVGISLAVLASMPFFALLFVTGSGNNISKGLPARA